MLWEHEPQVSVSTAFSSSPKNVHEQHPYFIINLFYFAFGIFWCPQLANIQLNTLTPLNKVHSFIQYQRGNYFFKFTSGTSVCQSACLVNRRSWIQIPSYLKCTIKIKKKNSWFVTVIFSEIKLMNCASISVPIVQLLNLRFFLVNIHVNTH